MWPTFDQGLTNRLVKCYLKRGRSKVSQVDYPLTNIRLIISGQCYECSTQKNQSDHNSIHKTKEQTTLCGTALLRAWRNELLGKNKNLKVMVINLYRRWSAYCSSRSAFCAMNRLMFIHRQMRSWSLLSPLPIGDKRDQLICWWMSVNLFIATKGKSTLQQKADMLLQWADHRLYRLMTITFKFSFFPI